MPRLSMLEATVALFQLNLLIALSSAQVPLAICIAAGKSANGIVTKGKRGVMASRGMQRRLKRRSIVSKNRS